MTAPTRTWSNPLSFRVEPHGIAVDKTNNIVYVLPSATNKIQKTLDNGATWTVLTNSPSTSWTTGYVTSTGRILAFAATYYYSDDYGTTWTSVTNSNITNVQSCDQNIDGSIYIGLYNGHIYKSTDNGLTFTDTSNNIPTTGTCPASIMHTSTGTIWIADGTSTGSNNGNMYWSSNNGTTWNASGYSGYSYTQFVLVGSTYYAPIFATSYVFNGSTGSHSGADIGMTQDWWGCVADNDGRYYITDYAGHVYTSTDMSSFTLAYTNTGGLFAGIVDAKDNLWISGSSNVVLGSVPPPAAKQLYTYNGSVWKPVTSIYVGVNGAWKLATPYGGLNGTWK